MRPKYKLCLNKFLSFIQMIQGLCSPPGGVKVKASVQDYLLIVAGALLQAVSYVLFLAPYKIVPGGIYGISIVLHHITQGMFSFLPEGLPMGITALCFNIPLTILAARRIGLSSGGKTIVTFLLVSVFVDSLTYLFGTDPLVKDDPFIAGFYGGAMLGLGVTCIFKAGGTSAGTDVVAKLLTLNRNMKISNMIMIVDSVIVVFGLMAFQDWSVPLYSWFTIFVYGKVVDMLQCDNPNRAVFIVSEKADELRNVIVEKLGMRGTFLQGNGMYKGLPKKIIFTITERKELARLKSEVRAVDPDVFISTMEASKDQMTPSL